MKRIFITLIISLLSVVSGIAQPLKDVVSQPSHLVARRINASGEITKEYDAVFSYSPEGKLTSFDIPEYSLSAQYGYEGDFFTSESIFHGGGSPQFYEWLNYSYEEERIRSIFHGWDAMNPNECWIYSYDEYGRLSRKDYGTNSSNITKYYEYTYENNGRTRIETAYEQFLDYSQWLLVWAVFEISTYQYDEDYTLLSVQSDSYDGNSGDYTGSTRITYSYTENGMMESQVTQTLADGEWLNTEIMRYVYDDQNRVVEQQNGTWSQEDGDWNINKKVVFETSNDNSTYMVSFYKKNGDDWVWDVFNNQKIFFESIFKEQQRALGYFVYEDMMFSGNINQFVFNMEFTEAPTYLSSQENKVSGFSVFPNPGKDMNRVFASVENAVVRFFDLQGRLIIAKPFDFSTTVNTGDWAPGIYLWEIWNGTRKEASGKWVKE